MKLLPLTLLLFTTASDVVLAEKTLAYTCYNHPHSTKAELAYRHKAGGVVGDALAAGIVKHMSEWSDHKYKAEYDLFTKKIVYVSCSNQEPSKEKALEAIKEQEKIVGEHRGD
jgi:hypothetical protein